MVTDSPRSTSTNGRGEVPGDPLEQLLAQLNALTSYTGHYAHAKLDLARARVRRMVLRAVAALVGGIFLIAAGLVAVIYLMRGAALGFSAACGERLWLGYLLAGASSLAVMAGAAGLIMWVQRASRRKKVVEKYELRKSRERARHGRDVAEASTPAN